MKFDTTGTPANGSPSWDEIRTLLAGIRTNLERPQGPAQENVQSVFRTRAGQYAVRTEELEEETDAREDVLQFSLGSDAYAVPCACIEEIIPMQNLVALPHTARPILGISSNRGLLFAVVDLKRILNIPASDLTTMHRLIILRHEELQVGLLVDVVHGMRSFDMDRLRDLPQELHQTTHRFLRGVSSDHVLLLRCDKVMEEIRRLSGSTETADSEQHSEQHEQVHA
ncbi:chemotaxis protein CheW [bacterium]|nr:chemotaxis protein CheW [bacterium]